MIAYPYGALFTGICLILAASVTLARVFLLEPGSSRYPKAPAFVRHATFGFGVVLAFIGLQFITTFIEGGPNTTPPQPTARMQFLALTLAIYQSALLVNIVRQRYPEEVWTKLNRLNDALPCKDRKFLAWLSK
jgi:hypothetical protein